MPARVLGLAPVTRPAPVFPSIPQGLWTPQLQIITAQAAAVAVPFVRGVAEKTGSGGAVTFAQADFNVAPQAGDLLVAVLWNSGTDPNGGVAGPTGWSTVLGTGAGSGDFAPLWGLQQSIRAWQNTDTTYTFTEGSAGGVGGVILAVGGADTAQVINAGGTQITGTTHPTNNLLPTAPAGSLLVLADYAYSGSPTITEPATSIRQNSTSSLRFVVAVEDFSAGGTPPVRNFTASSLTDALTLAFTIKPAAVSSGANGYPSRRVAGVWDKTAAPSTKVSGAFTGALIKRRVAGAWENS